MIFSVTDRLYRGQEKIAAFFQWSDLESAGQKFAIAKD